MRRIKNQNWARVSPYSLLSGEKIHKLSQNSTWDCKTRFRGTVRPVQGAHSQPEQVRIKGHQQNFETKPRAGQQQVGSGHSKAFPHSCVNISD